MEASGVSRFTRRQFLMASACCAANMGLSSSAVPSLAAGPVNPDRQPARGTGYNILFILTDQERYFRPSEHPLGYTLPGRNILQQRGLTFVNHSVNSAVCTSSRSVIYTGQHIQHTKLFDNMDAPWIKDLGHDIPTLGDMLGQCGYYPAYKGKWHMSKELGTHNEYALPQEKLTQIIESYGFKDYTGIGDVIGETRGGYLNDAMIGAQARRWLRLRGQPMNSQGKPWFLAVNLVNPHDVMFYNTDLPGQHVQDSPKPMDAIARAPDSELYRRQWRFTLPATRREPFDKQGRPPAHGEYQTARGALVGDFPNEDQRWERLINYYNNCILDTDRVLQGLLDEIETLELAQDTIVVLTSDHGELGGAHGLHGKGATAYREQNHVPLIISHPGYPQTHGQRCRALTSHLDLAPTLLNWTGGATNVAQAAARGLHGKDLTPLLIKGAGAEVNALRQGSLYCYNMFLYLDSHFLRKIQAYLNAGGDPAKLKEQGFQPDFTKRGAIRSVVDGRYRFSRYFSPREHNQPRTLEGLFSLNDVECFDLENDPLEVHNLAMAPQKNGELLLALNETMNVLLETELGEPDDGRFLPGGNTSWTAVKFDP